MGNADSAFSQIPKLVEFRPLFGLFLTSMLCSSLSFDERWNFFLWQGNITIGCTRNHFLILNGQRCRNASLNTFAPKNRWKKHFHLNFLESHYSYRYVTLPRETSLMGGYFGRIWVLNAKKCLNAGLNTFQFKILPSFLVNSLALC